MAVDYISVQFPLNSIPSFQVSKVIIQLCFCCVRYFRRSQPFGKGHMGHPLCIPMKCHFLLFHIQCKYRSESRACTRFERQ